MRDHHTKTKRPRPISTAPPTSRPTQPSLKWRLKVVQHKYTPGPNNPHSPPLKGMKVGTLLSRRLSESRSYSSSQVLWAAFVRLGLTPFPRFTLKPSTNLEKLIRLGGRSQSSTNTSG